MRAIIAICLLATVFAIDTNKFAVLLQAGTRGNDAVESVYNLLRDLKTENVQVQAAADKKNNTDEEIFSQVIGDLTNVASLNKQQWESLGVVRGDVEAQISEGYQWLAWAESRLAEIERRNAQLQDQRCWANGLFVKSLADHADAVAVVQILQQDVAGFLTNNAGVELVEKAQTIADKLSAYSHLFQQDALQKFQSLAEVKREGTTGEQVLSILQDLQAELESTLATLQEQEIHAAFALAKYVSDTNAEVAWLNSEHERRTGLVEKLETQLPAVLAQQAKALKLWKDSLNAVAGATADLEEKREFYASETARRQEENAIIDVVIQLFKDQVRSLASQTSLNRH
ncbi:unnamed protein product [Paramecium primaurelia]|uniref:Uncharacterized protein n=1 Tax=Paramecium primaurelia TaxID=5886 RepID=A0A8S1KYB4_PARPR|nr:unnamed protein product [Paramecium primaurelia]